ncbi:MerR family transcriptional regulator [Jannaschia sp. R86511]|uniref:MerR family transcriptional regulator n=1 Tax=Jannaschia sp. R86511 TaxID=3093853 RepID=UPI0036D2863E
MGVDMLSIGELAHRTGASRRMLRHWEEVGLLRPAQVDVVTGYRWYDLSQTGRVHAITALRAVGFGLESIADLLSSELSEQRLVALLHARERELEGLISEASEHLHQVRQRLSSLEEGHHAIMSTLQLGPIPALRLAALRSRVNDESEIGAAVSDLRSALASHLSGRGGQGTDVVMAYDGVTDADCIWVSVGVDADDAGLADGLDLLTLAGAERGATVRYDSAPRSVGDAWITLDAQLEEQGLRTRGVYRQTVTAAGEVVLEAPVVALG